MLAQILHDLYVPRELLDGLPEDQKQLLFCKMREEQVRRYNEREEEETNLQIQKSKEELTKKKKKRKQVTFRLDANGNEWCWVMGESESVDESIRIHEESDKSTNNENFDSTQNDLARTAAGAPAHSLSSKTPAYFTAHRDEKGLKIIFHQIRKQIEEISNNIQEARRIFERLESETRRLVLTQETEVLQQRTRRTNVQNDIIDDAFYREIEERAKKADRERREAARRARDQYHRNSIQLNVCFDSNNHTTLVVQPPPFQSPTKSTNRPTKNEKEIQIEIVEKPSSPLKLTKDQAEATSIPVPESARPKSSTPLTREDIRHWFCLSEVPYGSFRNSDGKIYPWFHGIISRNDTEQILLTKPVGSYLIRINEKIFGYALSYRASDHCRHLLIEVLSSETNQHAYRFLGGAKNELFANLSDLIEKYSKTPIRSNSNDVLRYPCSQIDPEKPDYSDLFPEEFHCKIDESLYISLETTTSSTQSMTHL